MMKKWLSVALISSAALLPHTTFASDALLQKAQQENRQQQSHNVWLVNLVLRKRSKSCKR